jgi:hypothetical protein
MSYEDVACPKTVGDSFLNWLVGRGSYRHIARSKTVGDSFLNWPVGRGSGGYIARPQTALTRHGRNCNQRCQQARYSKKTYYLSHFPFPLISCDICF